jgi:hypothetical protein
MPTPKDGYYLDGERIPSVTQIIHSFQNPDALAHWSWGLGLRGIDYREVRDAAANAGTNAHTAIERWVRGEAYEFACHESDNAFRAFREWAGQQPELRIVETEVPLISRRHRYAGTIDAIGLVAGKRVLLDWKTSARIYPSHIIQVSAYHQLWNENRSGEPIDGGLHVVRLDKRAGTFEHRSWTNLDSAWQAFLHMRALYDIDRQLRAA